MVQATSQSQTTVLDVQRFIDERPMMRTQWLILALCFFVLVADGFDTAAIAFVAPALKQELVISKLALGPVLSAALIGLACGALLAGPLADRIGRKRVLVGSVVLFSIWTLASAWAGGLASLWIFRFLTGIGIGAAMPNATTLLSEFVPAKRRSLLVNLMFCGFPLGASAGGFVAAWIIPHYGWRSVFIVGGIAPLVLAAVLLCLPESIRFMVVRQCPVDTIGQALRRIVGKDPEALARIQMARRFVLTESDNQPGKSFWSVMFSPAYRLSTLMLWLAYFMGLLLYYLLTSWMPILIRDAGYTLSQAALVTALFPLGGGVGALVCGWLMDRLNATRVVSSAYVITAMLLVVLSKSTSTVGSMMLFTFLSGMAMNGAQTSMPVLAAGFYPTNGRASGVSWMLGVGRLGGVAGALTGGVLLQAGFTMATIISGLAGVAFVSAGALMVKDAARKKRSVVQAAVGNG